MATITIRTDMSTDIVLEKLERTHSTYRTRRNTIIKAAILSFESLDPSIREEYLYIARNNDRRLAKHSIYY